MMYVVRMFRKDNNPNEEYYYTRKRDASYHMDLFRGFAFEEGEYCGADLLLAGRYRETILDSISC